jgi:beta-phosphoglucomutase
VIKAVFFDLDGVLLESCDMHWATMNDALRVISPTHVIAHDDHMCTFNGKPTKEKLRILSEERNLPVTLHKAIFDLKQIATLDALNKLCPDSKLIDIFTWLHGQHYVTGVVSNSIRNSTITFIKRVGIEQHVDIVFSNEDVHNPKPHPEMYLAAMAKSDCLPEQTLIIEDSPVGCAAALASKAHVLQILHPYELTLVMLQRILNSIVSVPTGTLLRP